GTEVFTPSFVKGCLGLLTRPHLRQSPLRRGIPRRFYDLHLLAGPGIDFDCLHPPMARKLRFIPEGGALVEVTCRTVQSRFLLRPSPELNEVILGVLGKAQSLYPIDLVAYVWLSNHFHLLLWVEDAQRLAKFMEYLNGNLAREVSRATGWTDKIWSRRYQA